MKSRRIGRGLLLIEFCDYNGELCTLQESSLATESCLWLGPKNADPKVLIPGRGWTPVEVPEGTLFNTRMHLSREQVADLLPILQQFVEHGTLEEL